MFEKSSPQCLGGFFAATTHPEAFGFYPSQEGIGPLSL